MSLLADGVSQTQVRVIVTSLGTEFLTGMAARTTVPDFPAAGLQTPLSWSEPHQNFVVGESTQPSLSARLGPLAAGNWESPLAGGLESGRALIRGWTCDAASVTAILDGQTLTLPYGSSRADTQSICGDSDNGYSLAINWNDYDDGEHQISLAIDGVALESRSFSIATPGGQGTVSGIQSRHLLSGFPHDNDQLTLQWSEPHQNYRIVGYEPGASETDYDGQVFTLFIGYFGRPPSPSGLDYYGGLMNASGGDWTIIADDFWNSAESQGLYPPDLSTREQINNIYRNLFSRDATTAGLDYWEGLIDGGAVSLPEMAYTIAYNASAADLTVLDAKRATATLWTTSLDTAEELAAFATTAGQQDARDFLADIDTGDAATQSEVDQAIADMLTGG